MSRVRGGRRNRIVRPTLLLVGEGLAEYRFLSMIKAVATRNCNGPSVTLRQASGKGALHVVDYASRQWRSNSGIDKCAVLLDADTNCYERALRRAREKGIVVMANKPCFEASLLRLAGITPAHDASSDYKELFLSRFGGEAHQEGLLEKNFEPTSDLLGKFNDVEPFPALLELLNYVSEAG